jgi:superfamily II DNA or RNA helicase
MPTGAGKTRTAMHVVCDFVGKNPDAVVVWLAYSSELLEQAAEQFEIAWSSLGASQARLSRFWGDHELNLDEVRSGLLVAGFAKLNARYGEDSNSLFRLGDRTVLTVVDEAHQAVAPTFKTAITYLHTKRPKSGLLGLTATPGRTWSDINEDAKLAEFFGRNKITLAVEGYSNPVKYLIDQGYLAKPTFRTLNIEPGLKLSAADAKQLSTQIDIPETILSQLAEDDKRNIKIVTELEDLCSRHVRVICFAANVAHAHLIASVLSMRGTRASTITGMTDSATRDRIITRFRGADPQPMVICNFGVLTTGFDAPKTSAALIARPTRSLVLYSQMVGRAIRGERAGGNKSAEIFTVVDPELHGFGDVSAAFTNLEDVWDESR